MLSRLEIRNLAIIKHAIFEPSKGLNVISGETGAGKSLLIDAIMLIMGNKSSKDLISSNEESLLVEALFDLEECFFTSRISPLFEKNDIPCDGTSLIIMRKVSRDGRSYARINGTTVTLSQLKEISALLVDIHGQNDTQRIFDEKTHIELLDSYSRASISEPFEDYSKELKEYKEIVVRLKELMARGSLEARKAFLNDILSRMNELKLEPEMENSLLVRKKEIAQFKKSYDEIIEVSRLLGLDSEDSVAGRMNDLLKLISHVNVDNDLMTNARTNASSIVDSMSLLEEQVRELIEASTYDPNEESEINKKLGEIYDLKAILKVNFVSEIITKREELNNELSSIDSTKDEIMELKKMRSQKEKLLLLKANELHEARVEASNRLSGEIRTVLSELMMPNARFIVDIKKRPKERFFTNLGTDDISFMFVSNPGQEPKKLSSICSGGEASRIMLAIKSSLSSVDSIPTLIFDEIDTGVSGKEANAIAERLKKISINTQSLCVTHTASVAASADYNYKIEKTQGEDETTTSIIPLDDEAKITEVSRLLSGEESVESRSLSKKLIEGFKFRE